ncbi:SHOCT domain-containing protein [Acidipropionibacterium jensenii]|uniref:SHOCT domain-containing protein n=1 Tax=Acidipropionibacterium jensenii TaxID=1749 RepID=UPI00110B7210|nr:SHOCT domain-containing protein [Acidipropionibacterium jensenii]QCV87742.1 SHOCT domain-containing protein [Acidipropionibacterium jensenii]
MSLLRTAARAHVATRVIGSTHRRQKQRWAAQNAAPAAPPAPPAAPPSPTAPAAAPATAPAGNSSTATMLDQLTQLGQLREAGVLTDAEFEAQKQRILAAG